jgi:arginase
VHDYGDVMLPDPSPERDPVTHLIDHHGLIALVTRVRDAVAAILDNGHFPLVIGGDCPLLLGCLLAAKSHQRIGLLFVDGHEDAYLPMQSSTGEAADTEPKHIHRSDAFTVALPPRVSLLGTFLLHPRCRDRNPQLG